MNNDMFEKKMAEIKAKNNALRLLGEMLIDLSDDPKDKARMKLMFAKDDLFDKLRDVIEDFVLPGNENVTEEQLNRARVFLEGLSDSVDVFAKSLSEESNE